jgi:hypothetical protein
MDCRFAFAFFDAIEQFGDGGVVFCGVFEVLLKLVGRVLGDVVKICLNKVLSFLKIAH